MTLLNHVLEIIDKDVISPIAGELIGADIEYMSVEVSEESDFQKAITENQPDLVITDYRHENFEGTSAIRKARESNPDLVFIIFTDSISEFDAVECIKAGVSNILNKDQISSIFMIVQETLKFQRTRIEKRQVEEQLAREREILDISLASIGEAIITIDQTGEIMLFNLAAQNITGFSNGEAVGKKISEVLRIFDEKTNSILQDPINHLLALEENQQIDQLYKHPTLLTKNQNKVLISGKISPILVDSQKNSGYVLIFDDVTEKELKAAQSLLSSKMESIGQLAAGIAHEINTPIQYLGDNINYLNRSFKILKELDDIQHSFIEHEQNGTSRDEEFTTIQKIRENKRVDNLFKEIPHAIEESLEGIERVRKIVLAIREFSHPSQKEMSFADINKAILTTITISRNEWKYCADLETDLEDDLPMVRCKIDELNQVLLNMIVNAVHAIQEKQKISGSEKGKIVIKSWHSGKLVSISISDTGCGIKEDIVNRIFDPFFTTKDVGKGTGQGLYLAHNIIVNNHHGTILVNTTMNVGTTFTLELPIHYEVVED